jgi:GAF domain-containing protein
MEPLPETREALAEFVSFEDPDPDKLLEALGTAARQVVPELVGLSIGLAKEQVTFTLVASDEEVAALDATQYLDGGPCVEVGEGRLDAARFVTGDPLDEVRWSLFAQANAAHGVATTLSLPLYVGGEVIGSVNMYAATPYAFSDHVEELALLVGAAPATAVMNADLTFSTRLEAAVAPQKLRDKNTIETAVGMIAGDQGIGVEEAHERLNQAAARAGLHQVQVAQVVIAGFGRRH